MGSADKQTDKTVAGEKIADVADDTSIVGSRDKPAFDAGLLPIRYRYLHEAGRGGMGMVVRVNEVKLGRDLALKTLLPQKHSEEHLQRFEREAMITGMLQHPGIPPVVELGELKNGTPFFSMKLIRGQTLAHQLSKRNDLQESLPKFLEIFRSIAQTLAYAHSRSIIHRDLKPQNIMIGAFGEVQVMDWGTARILDDEAQDSEARSFDETVDFDLSTAMMDEAGHDSGSLTRDGQVMGTISYMAPEQARGELEQLDQRTDVFGLGAILCEILTSTPPYTDGSVRTRLRKAMQGDLGDATEALDNSDASSDLIEICRACLSSDQERRPADASSVAELIASYIDSVEQRLRISELQRQKDFVQSVERRKRRRIASAMASMLILAIAGSAFLYTRDLIERRRLGMEQIHEMRTLANELDGHLIKLAEARDDRNWKNAELYAEQAESVANKIGGERNKEIIRNARCDLKLAYDLNLIPISFHELLMSASYDDLKGRHGLLSRRLAKYLNDRFGIENHILELDRQQIALIKTSSALPHIIDALDDWGTALSPSTGSLQAETFSLADQLDSNALNQEIRGAVLRDDQETLERIGTEIDLHRAGAYCLKLLAESVDDPDVKQKLLVQSTLINPSLLYNWIRASSSRGRSLEFRRAAVAANPGIPKLVVDLADSLREDDRLQEAEETLVTGLAKHPGSKRIWHNLHRVYEAQNRIDLAEKSLLEAIKIDPNYAFAYASLGVLKSSQGNSEAAELNFRKSIELGVGNRSFVENYISLLLREDRADDIPGVADWILAEVDTTPYAYYRFGSAFFREKRYAEASKLLEHSQRLTANNFYAILMLGECYEGLGEIDLAVKQYRMGVEADATWQAHYLLGRGLAKSVQIELSVKHFHEAIARGGNCHKELAVLLIDQGRQDEAIDVLAKYRGSVLSTYVLLAELVNDAGRDEETDAVLSLIGDRAFASTTAQTTAIPACELAIQKKHYEAAYKIAFNLQRRSSQTATFKRDWIVKALQANQELANAPKSDDSANKETAEEKSDPINFGQRHRYLVSRWTELLVEDLEDGKVSGSKLKGEVQAFQQLLEKPAFAHEGKGIAEHMNRGGVVMLSEYLMKL